ncbi:hypothetical protein SAMN04487904_102355 [Actinopolyspora lacussalsi subsp. righensis]|uniref:Proteins of 100 residues with WXG n=1 Tax=Actinopolyspora righensis TaxID=995060 RepID=A0A1I6YAE8_9ACTN|nr:hypothetical protein [Actinopolyspora righensis]SFT47496.1 hypothetical protein SAMN04487904_102355 [Actinopolyspora righensis]
MNDTAAQVNDKANEVDVKIKEFFDKANDILSWVPDAFSHLIDPVKKGLHDISQKMQEFWNDVKRFLITERGEPDALKGAGDQWMSQVGDPVHDTAGDIALPKLRTYLEWEGKASEAYKALVPAQAEGLKGIKGLAEQLRTSLTNLGNAIESFWTAVLIALGAFVVAIVAAIVEACGIVTLPAAIPTLLGAVGAAIGLIATAVSSTMSMVDTINAEQTAINQKIRDLGDEWTRSNADLSDATTNDGDASNWQVD